MSKLERVSHISVIGLAIVGTIAIIRQHTGVGRSTPGNSAAKLVGRTISIPSVSWNKAPANVVVAMTTHCPYCASSMGFYKRLAESLGNATATKKTTLIFASPEPLDVTSAYVDQYQIAPYKAVSIPLKDLDISGTPTLLIVDDTGRINHALSGKLSESNETIVLNMLARTGASASGKAAKGP